MALCGGLFLARSKDIMAGIQGWLSHFIGFVGPKSTPFFLRALLHGKESEEFDTKETVKAGDS